VLAAASALLLSFWLLAELLLPSVLVDPKPLAAFAALARALLRDGFAGCCVIPGSGCDERDHLMFEGGEGTGGVAGNTWLA
jgi:hypothetical protein